MFYPNIVERGMPRKLTRATFALAALMTFTVGMPARGLSSTPAQSGWWTKCVAISDNMARLACFDLSAPHAQASSTSNAAMPTGNTTAESRASDSVADIQSPADSDAIQWRASLGYGLGVAGHAGSFKTLHGKLRSDSGFGTEGGTALAQLWADNWIASDWSVGVEYMHLMNRGAIDLNLPKGVSIITDPLDARASVRVEGDTVFANIAYRPNIAESLESYIGAGLGVGNGYAQSHLAETNAFLGPRLSLSRTASLYAAPQAFIGMDLPMYNSYYLSLSGKAVFFTGHPIGLDQRYLDYVFSISAGRKF